MNLPIPRKDDLRQQRLMRRGFTVTAAGLCGLLAGVVIMLETTGMPAALLAAMLCCGLGVTVLGFAMMVVAADPFSDDELER